jgi:esterase/lipase superfamily enzyme
LDSEFAGVDQRLAQRVNEALAKAKKKEITLFVHGFNVPFDNPVLTSAELWYYQGFEGVGMSFSWPSSQKMLGYLDDIAKTHIASRHLTYLLRFLAVKTDAKKINIVAHSAGTRVLGRSLTDISLICGIADLEERKKNIQTFKLGKIIFASGDLSRDDMGIYMEYGILDLSSKTIIYTSANDKALSFSDWLWNQERIGQLELDPKKMTPVAFKFLSSHPELEVIDATDTPNSKSLYGHVYFLESPWVSSDLLLALNLGLSSEERGLVREEGKIVWKFPKDYKANPVFEKLSLKGLY